MSTKAHGPLLEDIRRHIKAAKKEGWREVIIKYPNGCEVVIRGDERLDAALPPAPRQAKLVW